MSAILTQLDETNVLGILTEALTTNVQFILADESLLVGANDAVAGSFAHANLLAGAPLVEVTHLSTSFCFVLLLSRRSFLLNPSWGNFLFYC